MPPRGDLRGADAPGRLALLLRGLPSPLGALLAGAMTCVVGIADGRQCWLGAESAAITGLSVALRANPKVWRFGPAVVGVSGSFRMAQLIRYRMDPPPHDLGQDVFEYLATDFIDAARACLRDGGHATSKANEEGFDGFILFGYRGQLYTIEADYQVAQGVDPFVVIGSGGDVALGVLYATQGKAPKARLTLALDAACRYNGACQPPYHFVQGGRLTG